MGMCQTAKEAGAKSKQEFAVSESAMGQGRGTVGIKRLLLCAFACQPASPLARRLLEAKKDLRGLYAQFDLDTPNLLG